MIVIGIDIGLTGAIGMVDSAGRCKVVDMPVLIEGDEKRIDGRELGHVIREFWPPGEPAAVVFENVRPRAFGNGGRQTNSMHSQGSMMRSRGVVEGVLDMLRLQRHAIQPQTWKHSYGLIGVGKDCATDGERESAKKAASIETALKLFPEASADLQRKKDHNRAEALLMARYWLRRTA